MQRATLHQDRRDRTLPRVELCFDDGAGRLLFRIRLEVEPFGLQQDLIEKTVDVRPLLRR